MTSHGPSAAPAVSSATHISTVSLSSSSSNNNRLPIDRLSQQLPSTVTSNSVTAGMIRRPFSSPTINDIVGNDGTHHNTSTTTITQQQSSQLMTDGGVIINLQGEKHATGPVTERLFKLIKGGTVQPDDVQLQTAKELDRVYHDLIQKGAPPPLLPSASSTTGKSSTKPTTLSSSSFFGSLFGSASSSTSAAKTAASTALSDMASNLGFTSSFVKGVYSYGGVGCGKTFLMDLLYDAIGEDDKGTGWSNDRQKVHYHKFMLNIHQFMHMSRKEQQEKYGDAASSNMNLIDPVVDHILQNGRLLCLDEFQVTDVADAMILKEIFKGLWKNGCVLVATSNRPPQDLYKDGLQRDRFIPFIKMLEERCEVISLMQSDTDYRMVISALDTEQDQSENDSKASQTSASIMTQPKTKRLPKQVYWFGKGQSKELKTFFSEMTKGRPTNPTSLETQGRKVKIPMACKTQNKSIAMFSFEDLCEKALGAADYLVIGQQFSTVFVYSIPQMNIPTINWLRRFITFVDTMYELKVTLILQTQAPSLQEIFVLDEDKDHYTQDEVFAFDRTLSRLEEMKSTTYLSSKWLGGGEPGLAGSEDDPVRAAAAAAPVKKTLILQPSLADSPTSFHEPMSLLTHTGPLGK
jgi:peroxisome-assembly ATPase